MQSLYGIKRELLGSDISLPVCNTKKHKCIYKQIEQNVLEEKNESKKIKLVEY
jgi:hypothetical protein